MTTLAVQVLNLRSSAYTSLETQKARACTHTTQQFSMFDFRNQRNVTALFPPLGVVLFELLLQYSRLILANTELNSAALDRQKSEDRSFGPHLQDKTHIHTTP